eukprot:2395831-Alexandrium_andersonii.AAC.1
MVPAVGVRTGAPPGLTSPGFSVGCEGLLGRLAVAVASPGGAEALAIVAELLCVLAGVRMGSVVGAGLP